VVWEVNLIMRNHTSALFLVLTLGAGTSVSAGPIAIIDQQNAFPIAAIFTNFTILGDGVTQGFTPALSGIDAVEFITKTTGSSTDIRIDVYEGDGDGGALLGSSGLLTITNSTFATTHFDFPSTIALTPGILHSFRLTHLGGAALWMNVTGSYYNGGIPRNPDGTPYQQFDLSFTEGLHADAVPEPATLLMMGTGLLGLARLRHRR
jgi:hypothetical protein